MQNWYPSRKPVRLLTWMLWLFTLSIVACSPATEPGHGENDGHEHTAETEPLSLPALRQVAANDEPVRIVATTGIIGDVVSAVAGPDAVVDVLMEPNQDPHGYQSTAGDLQLAANADAILVNGWRLEEGLIDDLENVARGTPIVPISAGIEPRYFDEDADGEEANRIDPHVWLSPLNVITWADNIELVLSTLDPANAKSYSQRAEEYREQLDDLDRRIRGRLETIEGSQRVLVTNHDAFGYFADEYGFTIVGTIVPGDSSLAEPASRELAVLIERMRAASICAIFLEHSANQRLVSQVANELGNCDEVQIVKLYSGALGEQGSGAETYMTMMEANTDLIVGALGTAGADIDADQG